MTLPELLLMFGIWFLLIYIASTTVSLGWWVAVVIYYFGMLAFGAK
jgi:hypothetical protein